MKTNDSDPDAENAAAVASGDDSITGALQRSDPRCGILELQAGDRTALFKLRALALIDTVVNWVKAIF